MNFIPKLKVYVKHLKWLVPVQEINFKEQEVEVDLSNGEGDTSCYSFDEIVFIPFLNHKDINDNEIYLHDLVKFHKTNEVGEVILGNRSKIPMVVIQDGKDVMYLHECVDHIEVIGNKYN